jgi:15-cis-phytoene desaturase
MGNRVIVFGGGVAGLVAAGELADRGFNVTVYEARHWGGKVRSMGKPGSGKDGRLDLPGEHGFHFFPSFYRHVPDTMRRIPRAEGGSVYDSLVDGSCELIARTDDPPIVMPSTLPRSLKGWWGFFQALRAASRGIPPAELVFFAGKTLQFMTACDERRIAEWDSLSWWDYVEADRMSYAYRELIARLPPLLLIAVHPQRASARTLGNSFISMLRAGLWPGGNIDRQLDGPPNDRWVDPWIANLNTKAELVLGTSLVRLDFDADAGKLRGAVIKDSAGNESTVTADHYVVALPLEVACPLITPAMERAAPSLASLHTLRVGWMNGLQLFLDRPFPVVHGHVAYEDTAWALTSVSQAQFWPNIDLSKYGDGRTREVFEVIISDWDAPGTEVVHKPARECSEREIIDEVFAQIQASLSRSGLPVLDRAWLVDAMIDPDIAFPSHDTGLDPTAQKPEAPGRRHAALPAVHRRPLRRPPGQRPRRPQRRAALHHHHRRVGGPPRRDDRDPQPVPRLRLRAHHDRLRLRRGRRRGRPPRGQRCARRRQLRPPARPPVAPRRAADPRPPAVPRPLSVRPRPDPADPPRLARAPRPPPRPAPRAHALAGTIRGTAPDRRSAGESTVVPTAVGRC